MKFAVVYAEAVVRNDIPKLSSPVKKRIKAAIEAKLMVSPDVYGKPLRRSLRGYRSLRVGDYRVIYRIESDKWIIKVYVIKHRSVAYKVVEG